MAAALSDRNSDTLQAARQSTHRAQARPADITWLAVSRTHGEHVGNVDMFSQTPLLIRKAELDWASAGGKPAPFKKDRPIKEPSDFDIFGDGSAIILATPGHSPAISRCS